MKGTPFIYQGQEIGMTNVQFPSIEDYDDVGMVNFYKVETAKGRPHDEIMKIIWNQCRDNARTPMQWDSSNKGGFTTADQTWLGVNPNYQEINVEAQLNDPDSILSFYRKLIELRKENSLFVYGTYELLLANHPKLFVYTRKLGGKKQSSLTILVTQLQGAMFQRVCLIRNQNLSFRIITLLIRSLEKNSHLSLMKLGYTY